MQHGLKLLLWLRFFMRFSISVSLTGLLKNEFKTVFLGTYQKSFSFCKPIEILFLAVVITSVPFLFNFILFVQTGHDNYDFNQCLIFTECCF